MVLLLDQETAEIQQFLNPEIVKIDQKNFGSRKYRKQAGTELGQAQLPTGIWFYYEMTRHLVLLYLLSRPTFQFTLF